LPLMVTPEVGTEQASAPPLLPPLAVVPPPDPVPPTPPPEPVVPPLADVPLVPPEVVPDPPAEDAPPEEPPPELLDEPPSLEAPPPPVFADDDPSVLLPPEPLLEEPPFETLWLELPGAPPEEPPLDWAALVPAVAPPALPSSDPDEQPKKRTAVPTAKESDRVVFMMEAYEPGVLSDQPGNTRSQSVLVRRNVSRSRAQKCFPLTRKMFRNAQYLQSVPRSEAGTGSCHMWECSRPREFEPSGRFAATATPNS
jgi:hypothetical protein